MKLWTLALIVALGASHTVGASETRTYAEVTVLGVAHSAQLYKREYRPAALRAWLEGVNPDVIAVEVTQERLQQADFYGFTYEIQDVLIPYAKSNRIEYTPFDWEPSVKDMLTAFRFDLSKYPQIRPEQGWGAFVQFNHETLDKLDFFYTNDSPEIQSTKEWAANDTGNINAEAARRLFLYRTHMQARNIERIARENPGKRIAVVVGYMHQADLISLLESSPTVRLRPANAFPLNHVQNADSYDRISDFMAIAWVNLFSVQSELGIYDSLWIADVLSQLEDSMSAEELTMLKLRFAELEGNEELTELRDKWLRLSEILPEDRTPSWRGIISDGRMDSDFDPFARLSLYERAHHEAARISCILGDNESMTESLNKVEKSLAEKYHAQYLGYWQQRIQNIKCHSLSH